MIHLRPYDVNMFCTKIRIRNWSWHGSLLLDCFMRMISIKVMHCGVPKTLGNSSIVILAIQGFVSCLVFLAYLRLC